VTRPAAQAVLVAALAVVAAALAMLAVVAAGWSPRVEYILGIALVAAIGVVALRRLLAVVAAPAWPSPVARPREAPSVDPRVGTIETALRRGMEDVAICRRRVQPLLFDLATHRLRRAHGVGVVEDPDAARELLGDDAFHLLTDVVERPPAVATVVRTVDAIERL
jgi:hypothetical protein